MLFPSPLNGYLKETGQYLRNWKYQMATVSKPRWWTALNLHRNWCTWHTVKPWGPLEHVSTKTPRLGKMWNPVQRLQTQTPSQCILLLEDTWSRCLKWQLRPNRELFEWNGFLLTRGGAATLVRKETDNSGKPGAFEKGLKARFQQRVKPFPLYSGCQPSIEKAQKAWQNNPSGQYK